MLFGPGSVHRLVEVLRAHDVRSCLLVTGGRSYLDSGASVVESALPGVGVVVESGVRANPGLPEIAAGVDRLRALRVDAVVGIGGGSALDYAKALAALSTQDGTVAECVATGRLDRPRRHLLVLVPTTAGTGSEVTSIAVMTVAGRKRSLHDPRLRADVAVVDPDLTRSLPAAVAASTGADALSQAVESYWSTRSTDLSRRHAYEAMTLAAANLGPAVRGDQDARVAMCRAAMLSGLAIDLTQTTVPHALSYLLTTRFGTPHGHACGVFLGPVLDFNASVGPADATDPRGAAFSAERIGEIAAVLGGRGDAVDALLRDAGLELALAGLGVSTADVTALVDAAWESPRRLANPRAVSRSALHELVLSRM